MMPRRRPFCQGGPRPVEALLHGSMLSADFPLPRQIITALGSYQAFRDWIIVLRILHAIRISTRWPGKVRLLMHRPMIVLYR